MTERTVVLWTPFFTVMIEGKLASTTAIAKAVRYSPKVWKRKLAIAIIVFSVSSGVFRLDQEML